MSCALFLAQVAIGADSLDFRTNTSFSLPPQHERGFGLFPEVSTFATHTIYLLAVLTVFWCSSRESKTDRLSGVIPMLFIAVTCLFLSKSSSVLIVLPAILIMAYLKGRPLTYRGLLGVVLGTAVLTVALQLYYTEFYLQRAEGSALRSMGLRLITIKTGLSVLENGEAFGVGLGNNEAVTLRAFAVAQEMGFPLLLLPKGVNSFVVARVFEEGWPALFCFGLATFYLLIAILSRFEDAALRCIVVLSLASFLVSLLVTGYRGIYMNWFWISAAPALIDWSKDRVSSVGKDAKCKH
ncbi:hypothetical protein [Ruegeria sp.]|uniref:hypothetical protein n=1 Tax=Ruegeria sp. TaxID=1879320 RepID=UPI003B5CEF3E